MDPADFPTCEHLDQLGHVVRGVYDGVLWFSCPACLYAWPSRAAGDPGTTRHRVAMEQVGAYLTGVRDSGAAVTW